MDQFQVGHLGQDGYVTGEVPAASPAEAERMAYENSLKDDKIATIASGEAVQFLVWGGRFFKKHDL